MKSGKLDREEKTILESFEKGEWSAIRDRAAEISRLAAAARVTLRKNRRINIRLSDQDLLGLQVRAAEEGMPYQTLISSVLHKYLTGALCVREAATPYAVPRRGDAGRRRSRAGRIRGELE